MTMRQKFILGFLTCILLSILSISAISLGKILEVSTTSVEEASLKQLSLADKYLRHMFEGNLGKLEYLAHLPEVREHGGDFPTPQMTRDAGRYEEEQLPVEARNLIRSLARMQEVSPQISKIFIGYSDGRFVSSAPETAVPGYDPRTRGWFSDMQGGSATTHVGNAYTSVSGEVMVSVSVRVPGKTPQGADAVVAADISLVTLNALLDEMKFGRTGRYVLFDADGKVLCAPANPEYIGKPLEEVAPHLRTLFGKKNGCGVMEHLGVERLISMTSTVNDWRIVSIVDMEEVREASTAAVWRILAASVVLLFGAVLLARSVCNPLARIMRTTQDIAQGRVDNLPDERSFSGELLELYRNLESSQALDRLLENHLFLIDLQLQLLGRRLRDLLCRNGAKSSSALSGTDRNRYGRRLDLRRQLLRLRQLLGRNLRFLRLLKLQIIKALGRCLHSQFLRQNKISRVSVVYFYNLALFSQALYILKQYNFHFKFLLSPPSRR